MDLLRNNYNGRSPPTYGESIEDGEGKLIPMETVLTGIEDLNTNHCLDYFLQFIPNTGINIHELEKKFFVDEKSIKIEKFLIEGRLFTQLSDHYGVSGNLKVKTKGERDEKPLLTLEITKGILN